MTSRAGSTVTWSSYNYPTSISAPDGEAVQLSYGPDRQRWKQTYTSSNPTEYTYYVGGLMEVVVASGVTTYRHYVQAGGEQVALYSRSGSMSTMSYVLGDHQGSVSEIASNTGASNVSDSFSAFGQLRNSSTWSRSPTTSELNGLSTYTRQGYTFQTMLGQSMGLNHMNGRVEDAILGRFLSPDPHIPDRADAQSYNRYSYVKNNPVSLAYPTGFAECAIIARQAPQFAPAELLATRPNFVGGGTRWRLFVLVNSLAKYVCGKSLLTGGEASANLPTGQMTARARKELSCRAKCFGATKRKDMPMSTLSIRAL